jgi:DNA-binding NtrC family response regulator
MKILVIDDDKISLTSLGDTVSFLGYDPVLCGDAQEALKLCRDEYFPIIITDIRMPGMDGLELLKILKSSPDTARSDVIMITGHGDIDMAITALRLGAYDFLRKPLDAREFAAIIERSAEHQALKMENEELTQHFDQRIEEATESLKKDLDSAREILRRYTGVGNVVAVSDSMKKIIAEAKLYHTNPTVPVLIEGETGTGKEIVAKLIHYGETPNSSPFVDINCSAISANLFESELFGYEPGAFTGGSRKGSRGKLEAAGEGTVFLDEVGDIPLEMQPKMLRVLQERTFYPVGGVKKRDLKARIICATNQELKTMVEQGRFRRDLYHRLKIGYIYIPPLRERKEDIKALSVFILQREAARKKKAFKGVTPEALDLLVAQPWPGNVRELENAIERAVLIHNDSMLDVRHFDFLADNAGAQAGRIPRPISEEDVSDLPNNGFDLDKHLDDIAKDIVNKALKKFDGNKTKAAKYLGWDRNKIYRLLPQSKPSRN